MSPDCFELVLLKDWRSSPLVFPCNFASFDSDLSSSSMSSEDASSSVVICSPEPSAKVKVVDRIESLGGS